MESESSLASLMSSPESSPSLFVHRVESSEFAPQTRVKSSQFTYRLESSLDWSRKYYLGQSSRDGRVTKVESESSREATRVKSFF